MTWKKIFVKHSRLVETLSIRITGSGVHRENKAVIHNCDRHIKGERCFKKRNCLLKDDEAKSSKGIANQGNSF